MNSEQDKAKKFTGTAASDASRAQLTKRLLDLTIEESETIKTTGSSSTTNSIALASPDFANNINTPASTRNNINAGFETPKNHGPTNYKQINISPTKLIAFPKAQEKSYADGIWKKDFATANADVMTCIYYLYGYEYASEKSPKHRIDAIRKMVMMPNLKRLKKIVFSNDTDTTISGSKFTLDEYQTAAISVKFLFSQGNASGGFPGQVFFRFQTSGTCFLASACVWFSLQSRVDLKDDTTAPINIARAARHHLLKTDADLERRVLHNKGGCALKFATYLTNDRDFWNWDTYQFGYKRKDVPLDVFKKKIKKKIIDINENVKDKRFGLVVGFVIPEILEETSKEKRSGYGYWKFDGESIDTKGVFVQFEGQGIHDFANKEQHTLREFWHQHKELAEKQIQKKQEMVKEVFPNGRNDKAEKSTEKKKEKKKEEESRTHSMVLLGTISEKCEVELDKGKQSLGNEPECKTYFVLLNWWRNMSLVVVSEEYLTACQASILFYTPKISKADSTCGQKDSLVAMCYFPDEGEDGCFFHDDDDDDDDHYY